MNTKKVCSSLPKITKIAAAAATTVAGLAGINYQNSKKEVSPERALDYIDKSAMAIAGRIMLYNEGSSFHKNILEEILKGREESLEDDSFDDFDFENIEDSLAKKIEDPEILNAELAKFKNSKIKAVAQYLYNGNVLYDSMLQLLYDLDVNSQGIKDKDILKILNDLYNEILNNPIDNTDGGIYYNADSILEHANNVIDAYNTITGKYVQYKKLKMFLGCNKLETEFSKTQEYLQEYDSGDFIFHKKDSLKEELEGCIWNNLKPSALAIDFMNAQKTEAFEALREKPEIQRKLYKIYLKDSPFPEGLKKECRNILKKDNVMLFPSAFSRDYKSEFAAITDELDAWLEASNGAARLPRIINLNVIEKSFLDKAGGNNRIYNDVIQIDGGYKESIMHALRHELMHENDKLIYKMRNIGEERVNLLKEIMPTKIVNGKKVRDFDNCKYREEFLKAGIDYRHIPYAYTDRNEFLAVAAEGDMSKYSSEFKDVLIKLGMPEFVFNLKVLNYKINHNTYLMSLVMEKYPAEKDYKNLVMHYNEQRKIVAERAKNLLSDLLKLG